MIVEYHAFSDFKNKVINLNLNLNLDLDFEYDVDLYQYYDDCISK